MVCEVVLNRFLVAVCASGRTSLVETIEEISRQVNRSQHDCSLLIVANGTGVAQFLLNLSHRESWDCAILDETSIGIPFARNAALRWAIRQGYSHLGFVDDDCVPEPFWLDTLISKFTEDLEVDVVAGSWSIEPASPPSPFIPRDEWGNQWYRVKGRPVCDGEDLPHAYTRNVMFTLRSPRFSIAEFGFDESRANLGGSDVKFFAELVSAGARILFAENASVKEIYSGERLTLGWHSRRKLRNAQFILERAIFGERIYMRKSVASLLLAGLFWISGVRIYLVKERRTNNFFSRDTVGQVVFLASYIAGILGFNLKLIFEEYKTKQ